MERQESLWKMKLAAGHNVILEIEVQGALNIKKQYEDALLILYYSTKCSCDQRTA